MFTRSKYIVLILIFTIIICTCNANSTAKSYSKTKIEETIDSFCKDKSFSGSILIVDHGKIILKKGYGFANYEDEVPNMSDTIFRIGSITKQFTAMGIMILEERGALKVSDPINKYIIGHPNWEKITIHNLLTHTSGIPEYTSRALFKEGERYYSPTDLIDLFKDKPLNFNPGEKFEYCNSNYVLLGYIIEKASNLKYEEFVEENIIMPLEMENTGYGCNEELPEKAVGYTNVLDFISIYLKSDYLDASIPYSAGALQSTIEDLYKWDQALYTNILLKKESMKKMFTPFLNSYGYGWLIIEAGEKPIMAHAGRINGFVASIYRNVKLKRTVIILSNNQYTDIMTIRNKILSVLENG